MRALLIAFLALTIAACDSNSIEVANAQGAQLLTDKRTYSRAAGVYVDVTLANTSGRSLYIAAPSFDTVLDRRDGDDWVEVGAWYAIGAQIPFPTKLLAGTYRTWPTLEASAPVFALNPGTYRIRTKVYEDEGLSRLLPESTLVSAPFEIVEG